MDLPEARITVHVSTAAIERGDDPLSSMSILSNAIEKIYLDLYDLLAQSFAAKCTLQLAVEPDYEAADHDIIVDLEGTTGDIEHDEQLKEELYDYTLRQLEAIIGSDDRQIGFPTDIKGTLYITDPKGNPLPTHVVARKTVNAEYTFFLVVPDGFVYPVAVLSSSSEQFIETNWKRKRALAPYSIFDKSIKWYDAKTSQVISGGLADYLRIDIDETTLR